MKVLGQAQCLERILLKERRQQEGATMALVLWDLSLDSAQGNHPCWAVDPPPPGETLGSH